MRMVALIVLTLVGLAACSQGLTEEEVNAKVQDLEAYVIEFASYNRERIEYLQDEAAASQWLTEGEIRAIIRDEVAAAVAEVKQGPQGPQGPQGDQGPIGPSGQQGKIGPKGDIGIQGSRGFTGTAGTTQLSASDKRKINALEDCVQDLERALGSSGHTHGFRDSGGRHSHSFNSQDSHYHTTFFSDLMYQTESTSVSLDGTTGYASGSIRGTTSSPDLTLYFSC